MDDELFAWTSLRQGWEGQELVLIVSYRFVLFPLVSLEGSADIESLLIRRWPEDASVALLLLRLLEVEGSAYIETVRISLNTRWPERDAVLFWCSIWALPLLEVPSFGGKFWI